MARSISIENAHQNNLKHLDLDLPHGELIVVTGVSGSGKSTLAFDTIYAEGQRRYVETFSPYARQFLDRMDKPRVDRIEGIPPAIAIDQTNPVRTSRSTVGTMTELNDHIKLLFARCANLHCSGCGQEVRRDTPEHITAHWIEADKTHDSRVMVSFRIEVPDNFSADEIEDWLTRQGFTRIHARNAQQIDVVQDRLKATPDNRSRFMEAVEAGLRYGQGKVTVHRLDEERQPIDSVTYSTRLQCESCGIRYRDPLPSTFSFNSPIGACESCRGFGRVMGIDYRLTVPDTSKSITEGVVKVFQSESGKACQRDLVRAAKRAGIPLDRPFDKMTEPQRDWLLQGDNDEDGWYGVKGFFDYLERKSYKMHVRVMLAKYRSYDECPDCGGARLKPESLNWRVGSLEASNVVIDASQRWFASQCDMKTSARKTLPGLNVTDLMQLPIDRLAQFVELLAIEETDEATRMVTDEMRARLSYLVDVGLGYLALDRQSRTLSGGEVQRINLTTALGTSLVNTLFVLDEPSIGLHPRDIDRLTRVLLRLRDAGNTLIVVEHDPQLMVHADRIVDIGPGPGNQGGEIVFNGSPSALLGSTTSLTADYLAGRKKIEFGSLSKAKSVSKDKIKLTGANGHNLKNLTLEIPLNKLVCITGPSGSGKSSLIQDTFYNALSAAKGKPQELALAFDALTGDELIDDVVMVDQSPIGKSARSNPVSYTGAFEPIRKLFERTPEAKERNYRASAFSFNSGMKCPACSGNGFEHVEMQFLSDVYIRCGECQGRRYRPELLEVKLFVAHEVTGVSIADVLDMTVDRALEFFHDEIYVTRALQPMKDVGLGYVTLGQPVPTLSGGEAQRLKLAAHLGEAAGVSSKHKKRGHTLFMFDEPTTGLHYDDIAKLLGALVQLLDQGHSLVVVEHNLDVISCAQHVVDLGPVGGSAGGKIVFKGSVQKLLTNTKSATAKSLLEYAEASDRLLDTRVAETPAGLSTSSSVPSDAIHVQNAREHNLKEIDVKIPRDAFTVITGKSGSGKSTLAFDIVFKEGQRRYLESLNAYARQFVQPASRPDVDAISGIPPTVAIEQRTSRGGRKSTVATMTEIYHFLRLLFVKLGEQYCPDCGVAISAQSVEAIASQLMKKHRGKAVSLHAPLVTDRKGYYTDLAKWAANKGFDFLRVDGEETPTANWPRLDRFKEHTIDLPLGRFAVEPKQEKVLIHYLKLAVDHGSGVVKIAAGRGAETLYSVQRACHSCYRSFPELDPRMFSYNSRHGWCPDCFGTGEALAGFDEEQTGEEKSWLTGDDEEHVVCDLCEGQRLKPESLSVWFQDYTIADFAALSIVDARKAFSTLSLDERQSTIAQDILSELTSRLDFLGEVGLDYLSLDRSAPTLSGGEAQRIRLAAQLGSNLEGVCYILDEPTIGLHPRDNRMLLDTLARLQSKGNTVIVVEHDEETIRHADHVIDMGPGAGVRGGEIVAEGTVEQISQVPGSPTGQLLESPLQHPLVATRAKADQLLHVEKADLHNLRNVTVDIPLQRLVCVSGVSGSGKSTLIRDVVHNSLRGLNAQQKKARAKRKPGPAVGCKGISGWQSIDRVLEVDQTPIGKTSRSCPATYIGFWDNVRRLFADTTEARIRGFEASRFSFNTGDGRCGECQGQGMQRIEMNFLPDVKVPCEACAGQRFNSETLAVRWKDTSIGELLMMNVDDALLLFEAHPSIHHPLTLLQDVGLGYLTLGQASATLSGGEAQRIKLVTELAKAKPDLQDSSGKRVVRTHTLYILDEPSVGLHMADVENLIHVLHRLVDAGNSVVLIEHNLDLIAEADWIIDMGPEGGDGGGRVVARGTPKRVAASKTSQTAPFLRKMLAI
jgi:excinuclease ABC subunit A